MRAHFISLAGLLLASTCLLAQTPSSGSPHAPSSGASLSRSSGLARPVTLPVVVRDKKDKLVPGLTKDDFTLTEDGQPQIIQSFSSAAAMPLTLTIALDTAGSMRDAIEIERTSSRGFLDEMVARPEDKASVLHFDREVELLEDLTPVKAKLDESLNQLGPSSAENTVESDRGHRFGAQVYDAIYLAANEILAKQSGRKVIVVIADGVDHGSKEQLQDAIEAAQKAEASVYTVYFKGAQPRAENPGQQGGPGQGGGRRGGLGGPGIGFPGGGGGRGSQPGGGRPAPTEQPQVDGRKIMQQIAAETGGRFAEAKRPKDFDDIYKGIAEELRQQSLLVFTPSSQGEGFHRIALTAKGKDLSVQTRAGYYGSGSGSTKTKLN